VGLAEGAIAHANPRVQLPPSCGRAWRRLQKATAPASSRTRHTTWRRTGSPLAAAVCGRPRGCSSALVCMPARGGPRAKEKRSFGSPPARARVRARIRRLEQWKLGACMRPSLNPPPRASRARRAARRACPQHRLRATRAWSFSILARLSLRYPAPAWSPPCASAEGYTRMLRSKKVTYGARWFHRGRGCVDASSPPGAPLTTHACCILGPSCCRALTVISWCVRPGQWLEETGPERTLYERWCGGYAASSE
jgi:hypothetical protein